MILRSYYDELSSTKRHYAPQKVIYLLSCRPGLHIYTGDMLLTTSLNCCPGVLRTDLMYAYSPSPFPPVLTHTVPPLRQVGGWWSGKSPAFLMTLRQAVWTSAPLHNAQGCNGLCSLVFTQWSMTGDWGGSLRVAIKQTHPLLHHTDHLCLHHGLGMAQH